MRPATARRPGPAEVRVRIGGIGSMAVGAVEAIGADVVGFARGDRVVFPLARNERVVLTETEGMDALVVDADRLIGVPRDVGDEHAARLLAPGLVARVLLKQLRPIRTGDRVRLKLESRTARAVIAAWARELGAEVVWGSQPADLTVDEAAMRKAHALAFRRGHLQTGSADVFAAIRRGTFDSVMTSSGGRSGAEAA